MTSEVQRAVAEARASQGRIDAAAQAEAQARQALALALVRYRAGTLTHLDLLDAETNLGNIRLLLLFAERAAASARLALDRATGALARPGSPLKAARTVSWRDASGGSAYAWSGTRWRNARLLRPGRRGAKLVGRAAITELTTDHRSGQSRPIRPLPGSIIHESGGHSAPSSPIGIPPAACAYHAAFTPLILMPLASLLAFRRRSHEILRIEAFSDAVFAFAITLLIVALEVPRTFDELSLALQGFFAFAISFALLFLIWYKQNKFFRNYGLDDPLTVTLNGVLLFVVLFYVYPLKFLVHALAWANSWA